MILVDDLPLYAFIKLTDVPIQDFDHGDDQTAVLFHEVPADYGEGGGQVGYILEQVDHHPHQMALGVLHFVQPAVLVVDGDYFEQVPDIYFSHAEYQSFLAVAALVLTRGHVRHNPALPAGGVLWPLGRVVFVEAGAEEEKIVDECDQIVLEDVPCGLEVGVDED